MKINFPFIGNLLLILLVIFFSFQLLTMPQPWIFLDSLNLLIHEVGHWIFLPFGQFMNMLGGSLFQILFPFSFFFYFLQEKDYFATSFILFWIGDNIINVSVYMRDAINMALPLLGGDGVIHDWNWLFTQMGLLKESVIIGTLFFYLGLIFLILSLSGMIYFTILQPQSKNYQLR